MLLQRQFLWKLEQGVRSSRPQYCQVTKWMDYLLRQMPCLMGFLTSVTSCTFNHRGWVHCYVTISLWCHPSYEPASGNEGARLQSHLYWTSRVLQGIWRQLRSSGTRKASQAMPEDQAHKCLLPSFSQTCEKGAYQDLPYWHQRPDCWRTHESTGTKWLSMSLPLHVQCVTSLSHQSEGVLCNWKYFGTYLGYLPTTPTSLPCDTFQLIPVSFWDSSGHSTSSYTVELVWFSLVLFS